MEESEARSFFPRRNGNTGERDRWERGVFQHGRASSSRARNSSAKGWRTCTTIKPSDLRPTLYGPRPDAPASRIFRRFSVDLEPAQRTRRRPFIRPRFPPYPIRCFLPLSFLLVLSLVEIRTASSPRCRRSNEAQEELHPEKRLAFGADGTPRIVSPEARLERTMEKSVSLRAFVTRTAA